MTTATAAGLVALVLMLAAIAALVSIGFIAASFGGELGRGEDEDEDED